ncbi:MAG: DUF2332 domain-containing protein [Candidatus Dormibacteria bacterium]
MTSGSGQLAARLRAFGETECKGSSPLYELLAIGASEDSELLDGLAPAFGQRSNANLLFAAVQYLLLGDMTHPLAQDYPSLGGRASIDAYPRFRNFCLTYLDEVKLLVAGRITQTNEVGRCAYLYPALVSIARSDGRPLSLVDAGTSAGLNLLPDRYRYELGGQVVGDPASPVRIRCRLDGDERPRLGGEPPVIASRVGVDLMPIDVQDDSAVRWLQACIWPEHQERRDLLEAAVKVARHDPPTLIRGNAVDTVFDILDSIPKDTVPVLIEMTALPYFSEVERTRWTDRISAFGRAHDVHWVISEGWTIIDRLLTDQSAWDHRGRMAMTGAWVSFINGSRTEHRLALHGPHGQWMQWLSD